jgi:hypothetical protein
MSRKILHRCDICGRFHAAYLVPAEDGQTRNYCFDCWKSRFHASPPQDTEEDDVLPNSLDLKKDSS